MLHIGGIPLVELQRDNDYRAKCARGLLRQGHDLAIRCHATRLAGQAHDEL